MPRNRDLSLKYRKSTFSGEGNCVEVGRAPDGVVLVRHSTNRDGSELRFTQAEWEAFLCGVKDMQFDDFLT